jgi:adenylate cyclase
MVSLCRREALAYAGGVSVTVRFQPSGREVRVPRGSTLLDAVRRADLPLASACGADGLCARCALEIVDGAASLAPQDEDERRAKRRNRVDGRLRLACRAVLADDATVRAPYW